MCDPSGFLNSIYLLYLFSPCLLCLGFGKGGSSFLTLALIRTSFYLASLHLSSHSISALFCNASIQASSCSLLISSSRSLFCDLASEWGGPNFSGRNFDLSCFQSLIWVATDTFPLGILLGSGSSASTGGFEMIILRYGWGIGVQNSSDSSCSHLFLGL